MWWDLFVPLIKNIVLAVVVNNVTRVKARRKELITTTPTPSANRISLLSFLVQFRDFPLPFGAYLYRIHF
jgi:hypothetical protein